MTVERLRPTVLRVTLHAYELSALVAAARWVAEGAEGDLPKEAVDQLRQVLDSYDAEMRQS
jgi:fructose-1,6-bisphosphatase/sedoheptulose 1,7-bisphosphatase-like protein